MSDGGIGCIPVESRLVLLAGFGGLLILMAFARRGRDSGPAAGKLNLHSAAEMILYAIRKGVIT